MRAQKHFFRSDVRGEKAAKNDTRAPMDEWAFKTSKKPKAKNNNKRGGFFTFPAQKQKINFQKFIRATIYIMVPATIAVLMVPFLATDLLFILCGVLALASLVLYDMNARKNWETSMTDQVGRVSNQHDRLVREVARNRNDIAILKDGLGEMASNVEAQGRKIRDSHDSKNNESTEKRMIHSILAQLGALGHKPRAKIGMSYDRNILELELNPPPLTALPQSEAEKMFDGSSEENYTEAQLATLVKQAVRHDQIVTFMQPVVRLPQRKTAMMEIFGRIRGGNGVYLPATKYMNYARGNHLVSTIDNLLLLKCLQMLRDMDKRKELNSDQKFVLNITSSTLRDSGFMGDFLSFVSENHSLAKHLVFELQQCEIIDIDAKTKLLLKALGKLGCAFSIDGVRDRRIDIGALSALGIRYLKLNAAWMIREAREAGGFSRIIRLKKQLQSAGIDLIAEHVESEAMMRELNDFSIDFGQGYLFGKPDHATAFTGPKSPYKPVNKESWVSTLKNVKAA